jgi:hypothetical protein
MDEQADVITQAIRFDMYTRQWNADRNAWEGSMLKAFQETDGTMKLRGVASSTIKDLHGDNMLSSALEDMERQANAGLTIFGNHSYTVPEDDYGHVETASIKQAGIVDADGDPIYDLAFEIAINDENDRAVKTWKSINKKSKLGLSIGAMIPPGGAVRDKKSGALTISHVELLETSIVGIPANPRSWIENAVRASMTFNKAATTIPVGSPQLTLDADAGTYRIEGRLDGINLGTEDVEITTDGVDDLTTDAGVGQPEITDAACPDCGHGKADGGGCQNAFHKDVDPDVTDAKIRIIEVDTGDDSGSSSQGASESEPAPEPAGASDEGGSEDVMAAAADVITSTESVLASLEPEVTAAYQQLLELVSNLNRELVASIGRESEAKAEVAKVTRQRDEIVVLSAQLMTGTNAILNKLADQPVGRRTVFREAKNEFDGLEGIYSRDFLSLLRSK